LGLCRQQVAETEDAFCGFISLRHDFGMSVDFYWVDFYGRDWVYVCFDNLETGLGSVSTV